MPNQPDTASSAVDRVAGLLDTLDVGAVLVDSVGDLAHVNHTAAHLLNIPSGTITAPEFAAAIRRLTESALNQDEVSALMRSLARDPAAEFVSVWAFADSPTHLGVVSKPAPNADFDGRIWAFYDNSAVAAAADAAQRAGELIRACSDALFDPQVLLEGTWRDGVVVDLTYRDVNRATCEYLGLDREDLIGHSLLDSLPNIEGSGLLAKYTACAQTGVPVILDAFCYDNEVLGDRRYYDIRGAQVRSGWMTLTWRDVTERMTMVRRVSHSEEQFRLLAENVADVVVRLGGDGVITWASNSIEAALGAPAQFWVGKQAGDFVEPEGPLLDRWSEGGTRIGRARLVGVDGTPRWIHIHSKPFFDSAGDQDGYVASFRVIDEEVDAEERAKQEIARKDARNRNLARYLQAQTSRLMAELNGAARYIQSILPGELDGPVSVTSRCIPSEEVGGDSYDYRWLDEDHLMVYLLDVSGHGVEPAMISVSVHNLLRPGTMAVETLLDPAAVLTELNALYQMDQHRGNFFTIWYGVYQASTRTLRFANSGHPPALVLANGRTVAETELLSTPSLPIGIAKDSMYQTACYAVPRAAEILLYSDGAFELRLRDGRWWTLPDFIDFCTQESRSPDWSLDWLVVELQSMTESGQFDDDCTVVRLVIP